MHEWGWGREGIEENVHQLIRLYPEISIIPDRHPMLYAQTPLQQSLFSGLPLKYLHNSQLVNYISLDSSYIHITWPPVLHNWEEGAENLRSFPVGKCAAAISGKFGTSSRVKTERDVCASYPAIQQGSLALRYWGHMVWVPNGCRSDRGADKVLAPPGRKQATATEDFEFHISYL